MLTQPPGCRDRFLGRDVTCTAKDDVWLNFLVITGPMPDRQAARTMGNGLLHIEPLELWLLIDNDQVHVVTTAEAVIRNGEQTIGVWWQIDAGNRPFFREDVIDQAKLLM